MTSAEEIKRNLLTLENQLGSDHLLELLQETTSYLASVRHKLRQNRSSEDWDAVTRQLHQLKGTLVIYGSTELENLLKLFPEQHRPEDKNALADAIDAKLVEALSQVQARLEELEQVNSPGAAK